MKTTRASSVPFKKRGLIELILWDGFGGREVAARGLIKVVLGLRRGGFGVPSGSTKREGARTPPPLSALVSNRAALLWALGLRDEAEQGYLCPLELFAPVALPGTPP